MAEKMSHKTYADAIKSMHTVPTSSSYTAIYPTTFPTPPPTVTFPVKTTGTGTSIPQKAPSGQVNYLPVLERIAKALEAIVERFC